MHLYYISNLIHLFHFLIILVDFLTFSSGKEFQQTDVVEEVQKGLQRFNVNPPDLLNHLNEQLRASDIKCHDEKQQMSSDISSRVNFNSVTSLWLLIIFTICHRRQ